MHAPRECHLETIICILRYLKSALGKGLFYMRNNHLQIEAYTDSNYGSSIIDKRSISSYCTFVGGNLVTWCSKKQTIVARLSAEAEFCVMAQGVCKLLWIR